MVNGKQIPDALRSLKIAGRHLARLHVALQFEADFLAFDELPHAGALDGRNVDECIGSAIVRLNEAEALGGIDGIRTAGPLDR